MNSPFKILMSCETATWETDRWGTRDIDKWPEGFPKPRTCSYCGSVHPEDLIELIRMGWELEASTKAYKTYWNPPGYQARLEAVLADITAAVEGRLGEPEHLAPVPPVKLYGNHLTAELVAEINALLAINRAKAKP